MNDKINDFDRKEIARQIVEGRTLGHIYNGAKNIYWEIKMNAWTDKEIILQQIAIKY